MRYVLFFLLFAATASAQPMPAPPQPKPIAAPKCKVTPATPKAGDLLVIDGSAATGNVKFYHTFPAGSFIQDGKKLLVAVPSAPDTKTWGVQVVYFKEESDEQLSVKVVGTDGPQPDALTPVEKLGAKVDALTKAVNDNFAATDKRLKALEQIKPIPPPVVPVDPLQASMQGSYNADGGPADKLALLASVYKSSASVVNDPNNKTTVDVFNVMHKAIIDVMKEPDPTKVTVLPNVRKTIAAELDKTLPTRLQPNQPAHVLDTQTRALIVAQFARIQKALEGVQP